MIASKVAHFTGHRNSIYTLAPGSEPNTFFSAGADGFVVRWLLEQPDEGVMLVNAGKPVYSMLPIPERNELFIGTATGNLHIADLMLGQEKRNVELHQRGIFDVKVIGNYLFSAGEDGKVKIWSVDTLALLQEIPVSEKSVRCLSFSPDGKLLAAGCSDQNIYLIDGNGTLTDTISEHGSSVFSVVWSPDSRYLISGGRDARLHVHEVSAAFAPIETIPAHNYHINHIAYNPKGNLFATASMDKTVKIWDSSNFQLLKVLDTKFEGHLSSVNRVLWLNDEELLTASDDRQIIHWKVSLS